MPNRCQQSIHIALVDGPFWIGLQSFAEERDSDSGGPKVADCGLWLAARGRFPEIPD